jgi:hypothetical protein
LASLSMNKNMSVVVTARALSTSRTSYAKLWTRAGDRPSVDFYDVATQSSSTPQVAYSACDVRDINGDLFFGVSNPTTSYYYGLDFEFITKTGTPFIDRYSVSCGLTLYAFRTSQ